MGRFLVGIALMPVAYVLGMILAPVLMSIDGGGNGGQVPARSNFANSN